MIPTSTVIYSKDNLRLYLIFYKLSRIIYITPKVNINYTIFRSISAFALAERLLFIKRRLLCFSRVGRCGLPHLLVVIRVCWQYLVRHNRHASNKVVIYLLYYITQVEKQHCPSQDGADTSLSIQQFRHELKVSHPTVASQNIPTPDSLRSSSP